MQELLLAVVLLTLGSPDIHSVPLSRPGDPDHQAQQSFRPNEPLILRETDRKRTPVGLVYTPEMLSRLSNSSAMTTNDPSAPASMIAQAIERNLALVVMWPIPEVVPSKPDDLQLGATFEQQYRMGIEYDGDRVRPIWIRQGASGFEEIVPDIAQRDVGAIAAFPVEALKPESRIVLYVAGTTAHGQPFEKRRIGMLR